MSWALGKWQFFSVATSYNMLWGYRMAARQILLPWIGNKVLRGYSTSWSFVVLYDICMQNKSHWMERGEGSRNKSSPSQWKMTHPTPKHLKMLFFCLAPNICLATIYLTLNFFFNIGILTIKRIWSNEKQKCVEHVLKKVEIFWSLSRFSCFTWSHAKMYT